MLRGQRYFGCRILTISLQQASVNAPCDSTDNMKLSSAGPSIQVLKGSVEKSAMRERARRQALSVTDHLAHPWPTLVVNSILDSSPALGAIAVTDKWERLKTGLADR